MTEKEEIREVATRWWRAVDACRWDEVRSLLCEDFVYSYTDAEHEEFPWFTGADEAVRRLQGIAGTVEGVQHYLANSTVTLDGDQAMDAVYNLALIAPKGIKPGDSLMSYGAENTFHLRRESESWRIHTLVSETVLPDPWQDDKSAFPPRGTKSA
ncbi:nuclear transport factor 2 family protein [Streptomyces sp. NPDC005492]|uniref:nuclear transport factor 2 family protein n=1 Tax=Streptomyces sp. NPDC005492 TaxID=3156883 RepID=UPI0033B2E26C